MSAASGLRTGSSTGGTPNGMVNGFGSRLAAMRSLTASFVRANRSAGSIRAALPKRPSFSSSRRLSSIANSPQRKPRSYGDGTDRSAVPGRWGAAACDPLLFDMSVSRHSQEWLPALGPSWFVVLLDIRIGGPALARQLTALRAEYGCRDAPVAS